MDELSVKKRETILCLFLIISLFFIQTVSAEIWSEPELVSENGSQTAIAVGKNNTLHFVWIENESVLMYKRIFKNGTTDIDSVSVANYDGTSVHLFSPDIVVDSKNNAHIVVQYHQVTYAGTYNWALYVNMTSDGTRAERSVVFEKYALSGGWTYDCLNPRIAIDPIDDMPAIIMKIKESQTYFSWLVGGEKTKYWDGIKIAKKNEKGSFDWRSVMRTEESSPIDLYDFPALAIVGYETYDTVWFDKTENKISYKFVSNITSDPVIVFDDVAKPWSPSIYFNSNDNTLHIAWEGVDGNIYYEKSPISGSAIRITDDGTSGQPKIVMDCTDTVHFIYKTERENGTFDLYHYNLDDSSGEFITNYTNASEVPFRPDIDTDGLNIYVSWQNKGDSISNINFSRTLQRPIILLPGIAGTQLYNNGEHVWPIPEPVYDALISIVLPMDLSRLITIIGDLMDLSPYFDTLQLDSTGTLPLNSDNMITTGDVLRLPEELTSLPLIGPLIFQKLDFYGKLITELENEGYEENQNLWVFPYDWRLDNRENAKKLEEKIDQILNQTGEEKITIIAHSTGGLISKQFMNTGGAEKVDKFIPIGTPNLGSAKAFEALHYGYNFDNPLLKDNTSKKMARNMTSAYQLLPSKKYFEYSAYFIQDIDNDNYPDLLNYDQTVEMLKNTHNMDLVENAIDFHENIDEWSGRTEGVKTYVIVGSGFGTMTLLAETPSEPIIVCRLKNGDKTVPIWSAAYIPDSEQIYYVNVKHGDLPNDPAVIELIINILKSNENPEVEGVRLEPYPYEGMFFSVLCPVELHFYNSMGNHTGPLANGMIEEGIPDSQYDIIETSKFGFIPKGEEYYMFLNSTGTGYFDHQIQIYDNDTVKKTILYKNVQIIPETRAKLFCNDGMDDFTLDVDYDGDGIFESIIEPNVIYEGEGPNKTAISIAGKPGMNDWYISDVTITLIPAFNTYFALVEFSLDNGITWQNYTQPLTLASDGVYNLLAKSAFGNKTESPSVGRLIKVDQTPPITSINLNGTRVNDSFFNSNITVTLIASDGINSSGLDEISYSIDNGSNWIQYNESFVISFIGKTIILYKSKDKAGNIEPNKIAVVELVNLAPILKSLPDVIINETELIKITPTATDPENDTITFYYSHPLNSSGMWQTTYDDAGIYTTTVTVSDGYTNVSQDVKITVLNVNRPPILSPIGTLTALESTYFIYHVNATDPDNDQLTYYDNTNIFDINQFTGEICFTPKNVFVGNHSVNISVSDGDLIGSQVVTFVIKNINNPPAMEFVFPHTASAGTNFTLQVNANDPDGDQLIYSDDTDIFEINSTTGLIRFTANSSHIGTHFVNITVTDGIESDTVVLNLVVIPDKSIKLEPIQNIIAYAGDLVKIVVNFTRL